MRPFNDDYDDLDEFEDFLSTRRLLKEKRHHKHAGRKHHTKAHNERWENDGWDGIEYDDYYDDEFDAHYGMSIPH